MLRHSVASLLLAAGLSSAYAAPIATRAALQAILGGPGTLENFEAFSVGAGNASNLFCPVLSSAAVCGGQGPGLVVPGVNFIFSAGGQWDGAGYFGAPSREILDGSGQPLIIDFTVGVTAFGVDLRAFEGFPATASMDVYAGDDTTLLGTVSGLGLSTSGVPVFAGWSDNGGIGRVVLTQAGQNWSPLIDNLGLGNPTAAAVPEPSALALLGMGLAGLATARRRRVERARG